MGGLSMTAAWPAYRYFQRLDARLLGPNHFMVSGSMMEHCPLHLQVSQPASDPLHTSEAQHLPLIIADHRPAITEGHLDGVETKAEGANT